MLGLGNKDHQALHNWPSVQRMVDSLHKGLVMHEFPLDVIVMDPYRIIMMGQYKKDVTPVR